MPNADRPQSFLLLLCIALLAVGTVSTVWLKVKNRKLATPAQAPAPASSNAISPELLAQLAGLEERTRTLDQTLWAKERLAQRCGEVVEYVWDNLNQSSNQLETLAGLRFSEIIVSQYGRPAAKAHGIQLWQPVGGKARHSPDNFRAFLQQAEAEGWSLVLTEFRHNRFETDASGQPRRSVYYCAGHVTHQTNEARVLIEGNITIDWANAAATNEPPAMGVIDASGLSVKRRDGPLPFELIVNEELQPVPKSYFIDPLIVQDLDNDGHLEIILAAKNIVLMQRGAERFASRPLCEFPPGLIYTGVISDFDGDRVPDFVCAKADGLYFFKGSAQGRFDRPGELAWTAQPRLQYAQALSSGDIDGDGDLDLWLGQYKVPYENGQMPTPFYDANDGNPSFLLRNDGQARFTDITKESGLGPKQHRRAYGGSFADLDSDGDLDLIVVADFAGADLYLNDGAGNFQDVTAERISERHAFGMGHALTDFNADGRLDFLMIGMNSPTVDRLRGLGLVHPSMQGREDLFEKMTYGNRLYLGDGAGRFTTAPMNDSIARSGWAWGCAAADFDNDGWPDVHVANGHSTSRWVRDYEPEFWLHDIYEGNSSESPLAQLYFRAKIGRTRSQGCSYGGFERNRFYLSDGGRSYFDAAHLFGVGMFEDSRNTVAEDLDSDGKLELLVTTFETEPKTMQTLKVFRNRMAETGNWIGVRFAAEAGSPVGARVTAFYGERQAARQIVAGDSYRSQHSFSAHFGLGNAAAVDRIEIAWPNRGKTVLTRPEINRWIRVTAPPEG